MQVSLRKLASQHCSMIMQGRHLRGNMRSFFFFLLFVVGDAGYMQGRVIREKIWYRCKQRLRIFIRSYVDSLDSRIVQSALAQMSAWYFSILRSVFVGMLYSAVMKGLFSKIPTELIIGSFVENSRLFHFTASTMLTNEQKSEWRPRKTGQRRDNER